VADQLMIIQCAQALNWVDSEGNHAITKEEFCSEEVQQVRKSANFPPTGARKSAILIVLNFTMSKEHSSRHLVSIQI
jgi:hypothetical protein